MMTSGNADFVSDSFNRHHSHEIEGAMGVHPEHRLRNERPEQSPESLVLWTAVVEAEESRQTRVDHVAA
jgi:hypothetical protein